MTSLPLNFVWRLHHLLMLRLARRQRYAALNSAIETYLYRLSMIRLKTPGFSFNSHGG